MVEDLRGAVEDGNQTSDREEDVVEHVDQQHGHPQPVHTWYKKKTSALLDKFFQRRLIYLHCEIIRRLPE